MQCQINNFSFTCVHVRAVMSPGVGGSQLSGVSKGSKDCEGFSNTTVLWFADHWLWKKHMRCWAQHMSLQFDKVNGR
jgi:hypothetical protein